VTHLCRRTASHLTLGVLLQTVIAGSVVAIPIPLNPPIKQNRAAMGERKFILITPRS
jgi:hypothetical protein